MTSDIVIQAEAERLATRLEAEENCPATPRYAMVDRVVLRQAIKFLRKIEGDYAHASPEARA